MSNILDTQMIDAIGISKEDRGELVLSIFDHLDFEDEYTHLMTLQEKLNNYIGFIEDEDYKEVYPKAQFDKIKIQIYLQYPPSDNCKSFVYRAVQPMLDQTFGNVLVELIVEED